MGPCACLLRPCVSINNVPVSMCGAWLQKGWAVCVGRSGATTCTHVCVCTEAAAAAPVAAALYVENVAPHTSPPIIIMGWDLAMATLMASLCASTTTSSSSSSTSFFPTPPQAHPLQHDPGGVQVHLLDGVWAQVRGATSPQLPAPEVAEGRPSAPLHACQTNHLP